MTDHLTPARIAELRALIAGATEAPWVAASNRHIETSHLPRGSVTGPSSNPSIPSPDTIVTTAYSDRFIDDDEANLKLIAAARTALPAALDALDAKDAVIADLKSDNALLSASESTKVARELIAANARADRAEAALKAGRAGVTDGWTPENAVGRFREALVTAKNAAAETAPPDLIPGLQKAAALAEAGRKLISAWSDAPDLPEEMEIALSQFEDALRAEIGGAS